MNCKPGDLVRYVGPNIGNRPNVFGWVGTVVAYTVDELGVACWKVNPPLPGGTKQFTFGFAHGYLVRDSDLRPLRDTPGEDETLQWLKVPSSDLVTS